MPQLARVLSPEDLRRREPGSQLDLIPYLGLLETVRAQEGVGGIITLTEGERQRTEKRRLSLAAKQLGVRLSWRKADPDELRFVLAPEGQPAPGSRTRHGRTPGPPLPSPRRRRRTS
jgi:hypothetical protein